MRNSIKQNAKSVDFTIGWARVEHSRVDSKSEILVM